MRSSYQYIHEVSTIELREVLSIDKTAIWYNLAIDGETIMAIFGKDSKALPQVTIIKDPEIAAQLKPRNEGKDSDAQ